MHDLPVFDAIPLCALEVEMDVPLRNHEASALPEGGGGSDNSEGEGSLEVP